VKVYRLTESGAEQLVRLMSPGDFLGETALLADATSDHFAEAIRPSEICSLGREPVTRLLAERPGVALQMLQTVSDRLGTAEQRLSALTGHSAGQRLTQQLLYLADEAGSSSFRLPTTKKDLASYVGTSPETLSRRLGALQESGIIRLGPAARSRSSTLRSCRAGRPPEREDHPAEYVVEGDIRLAPAAAVARPGAVVTQQEQATGGDFVRDTVVEPEAVTGQPGHPLHDHPAELVGVDHHDVAAAEWSRRGRAPGQQLLTRRQGGEHRLRFRGGQEDQPPPDGEADSQRQQCGQPHHDDGVHVRPPRQCACWCAWPWESPWSWSWPSLPGAAALRT
jgi:hypothetical protein